ncbi:MAG: membrane protein insertion efficiency factor YidD [Candidatus Eremiobacteraeota bacterium]|nr:membrane protein insertion efficiency factor YidD [Candidatus Eremiobacteraeota bacterium]
MIKKIGTRRIFYYILVIFFILVLFDLSRLPDKQISAKMLIFAIGRYQKQISPRIGGFVKCKFTPTCSEYGRLCIKYYGAFWGSIKTTERILRCTPWSNSSGADPP